MRFTPCLECFFKKESPEERIVRFKKIGFRAFEMWGWWDKDLNALEKSIRSNGLPLVSLVQPFVSLVDPALRGEYLAKLDETIEAAKKLGAVKIISQTGRELPGVAHDEAREFLIETLRQGSKKLEKAGVTLIIEPINTIEMPGYFLTRSSDAFHICQKVASPNVKFVFDIYHQQIMEGNLSENIRRTLPEIAHFHFADHPGRHEPGTGEINLANVFRAIEKAGYSGDMGIELFPSHEDHEKILRDILLLETIT
ncbi:MAG: TIM barrel protein [Spirochaetia bacterium]|nr:TIM barrel protein [Spirochaetia bacterium]